ncbi:DUF11 domain-containing protein, partial [Candidatus Microgenomates bacterium]|nr:DUF11 domain-containing protein [Candidatus Microgenomates bacterium]
VSAQLDTYLYNLTKNVRTYTQSVEAERGDELIYRVTIRNTGNTTLTNTGFKVEVPAGLEFVDGYSRFYYGDGFENIGLSANIVSAGGVALMDIPAQPYRYVTYKVKVSSNASAGIYATSNKFQANNRAVNISDNGGRVNVKVAGQPSVTRILSLSAKAFNGTSYANSISVKRGDAVKFRVDFKNDGSQDLSNIRITNSLPANMTYVAGSMKVVLGSATISTSDSVFNAGINLGSLTVGQNGYMEFSAKVNSDTADNVTQLVYTATGNADNTAQISSLVTINLAKDGVLPDTGTPGSIASLILLAMFIAIASYIYFKETNGLNKVLSIIKK